MAAAVAAAVFTPVTTDEKDAGLKQLLGKGDTVTSQEVVEYCNTHRVAMTAEHFISFVTSGRTSKFDAHVAGEDMVKKRDARDRDLVSLIDQCVMMSSAFVVTPALRSAASEMRYESLAGIADAYMNLAHAAMVTHARARQRASLGQRSTESKTATPPSLRRRLAPESETLSGDGDKSSSRRRWCCRRAYEQYLKENGPATGGSGCQLM
jgi:hypothetical protein